jgi:hypothetical protein
LFDRSRGSNLQYQVQYLATVESRFLPLITLQEMANPSDSRSRARQPEEHKPKIVAVLVDKRAFISIDEGRCTTVYRQFGILVSIRLLKASRPGRLPRKGLANGKKLSDKRSYLGLGQILSRHDDVVDADSLDLVFGSGRGSVENT